MKYIATAFAFLILGFSAAQAAPGTYEIDKSHTNILFFVSHLGYSDYMGRFADFDGSVTFDKANPTTSKVSVTINPASIVSASAKLDQELQGPDFFNTAKFPSATFVSNSVETTGADTGKIHGTFTFLGVAKPLTLDVKLNKCDYFPLNNFYACGFHASGTFKRSDFGLSKYVPMVSDEVTLFINTEMVDKNNKKTVTPSKQQ